MPDSPMVWTVPVATRIDANRRHLQYRVTEHGDVVLRLPPGVREVVIPAASDEEMCDNLRQARAAANGMGQDL